MSDLVQFLTQQLDEDERVARAAMATTSGYPLRGTWATVDGEVYSVGDLNSPRRCDQHPQGVPNYCDDVRILLTDDDPSAPHEVAEHAARWDPVRVLVGVTLKRRVVAACVGFMEAGAIKPGTTWNDNAAGAQAAELILRLMAMEYAGHAGYSPAWTPPSPLLKELDA